MSEENNDELEATARTGRRPMAASTLCAFGAGILLIIILLYFAY